ncbi:MAG TPA: hypothetical protein VJB16_00460, partial [archaeon]|nr:hypothetical protein [archaeon]
ERAILAEAVRANRRAWQAQLQRLSDMFPTETEARAWLHEIRPTSRFDEFMALGPSRDLIYEVTAFANHFDLPTFGELTAAQRQLLIEAVPEQLPKDPPGDPQVEEDLRMWVNDFLRPDLRALPTPERLEDIQPITVFVVASTEPWGIRLRDLLATRDESTGNAYRRTVLATLRNRYPHAWQHLIEDLRWRFGKEDQDAISWLKQLRDDGSLEEFLQRNPSRGLVLAIERFGRTNERTAGVRRTAADARRLYQIYREYHDRLAPRQENESMAAYKARRKAWVDSHVKVLVKYELPDQLMELFRELLLDEKLGAPRPAGAGAAYAEAVARLLDQDEEVVVDALIEPGERTKERAVKGMLTDELTPAQAEILADTLLEHIQLVYREAVKAVDRYESGQDTGLPSWAENRLTVSGPLAPRGKDESEA